MGKLLAFEEALANFPGLKIDGVVRASPWPMPRLRVFNRARGIAFLVDLKVLLEKDNLFALAKEISLGVYTNGISLANYGPEVRFQNYEKVKDQLRRRWGDGRL